MSVAPHLLAPPARWRRLPVVRLARCMTVSIITSVLSLSLLAVITQGRLLPAAVANVVATSAGIGPSYALNRRWAWQVSGPSDLRRQVLPFWAMSIAALVLSTVAVAGTAQWADASGLDGTSRTLVVLAANVSAFGLLWIAQFLLLDRVLFARRRHQDRS